MMKLAASFAFAAAAVSSAYAADPFAPAFHAPAPTTPEISQTIIKGRASVIDGRTLWFPQTAQKIRLADIDACELPQWALDPDWKDRKNVKAPNPVPCGPLARAWLKRNLGTKAVECTVTNYGVDGTPEAYCRAGGRDIALEMLRVGWARVSTPFPRAPSYIAYQTSAVAARYGMWATYVLDMNEWRRKAVDRTADRQPIADHNLLATRESEISPPFIDARNKPHRTDR